MRHCELYYFAAACGWQLGSFFSACCGFEPAVLCEANVWPQMKFQTIIVFSYSEAAASWSGQLLTSLAPQSAGGFCGTIPCSNCVSRSNKLIHFRLVLFLWRTPTHTEGNWIW